jgi:hypothetical protein
MIIRYSEIYVYPYATRDGERIHACKSGYDDLSVEGWHMQSFGMINGTAGVIDDQDFDDVHAACDAARHLARQHALPMTFGMACRE